MQKKISFLVAYSLLSIFFVNGQVSNPVFQCRDVPRIGFQAYLNINIAHFVSETLLNPEDTSLKVKNSILFFFKFNIDSLGNVENLHFSNEDPPVNYNQIKDTLTDTNRIIQLNHLIDSAMHNPSRHGYWVPARNGNVPCKSKIMFVQVMYQPDAERKRDAYYYFPNSFSPQNEGIISFFKTNEEMIFLGCLYVNGFVQY